MQEKLRYCHLKEILVVDLTRRLFMTETSTTVSPWMVLGAISHLRRGDLADEVVISWEFLSQRSVRY